eukprot:m51a1_g10172 hypothetical protein (370) ;mRNA; r:122400-142800
MGQGLGFAAYNDRMTAFSDVAVQGVGDVNGDGVDDVAMGDPEADGGRGRVYVVLGGRGPWSRVPLDPARFADVDAGNDSTSPGFVVAAPGAGVRRLGMWVCARIDINGDRVHDLVTTSHLTTLPHASAVWALLGGPGIARAARSGLWSLNPSTGFSLCFSSPSKYFCYNNVMSMPEVPEVFTISWAKRSFLKQFKVETTYLNRCGGRGQGQGLGFAAYNDRMTAFSDVAVQGVGDVNGDGVDDVAMGDPEADGGRGRVYVVLGGRGPWSRVPLDPARFADVDAGNDSTSPGFVVAAPGAGVRRLGMWVCARIDINGDRVHDLVTTSHLTTLPHASAVWALLGGPGIARAARSGLWSLNPSTGFSLEVVM